MKFRSVLTAAVLVASTVATANAEPSATLASPTPVTHTTAAADMKDYEAIRHALGLYIEGGRQGKSAVMKPAFHADAVMRGGPNDSIDGGPVQALFDYIDTHPAAASLHAQITKIEVQSQIAYARIESDNWNGARFSDMFLLVKDQGNWKILTKVFHQHATD